MIDRIVLTGVVLGCVVTVTLALGWLLVPALIVRKVFDE